MICYPSQQGVYLSSSFVFFFQFVLFGVEILKLVPGRVSTEVDARSVNLSYNKSKGYTDSSILVDIIIPWL